MLKLAAKLRSCFKGFARIRLVLYKLCNLEMHYKIFLAINLWWHFLVECF